MSQPVEVIKIDEDVTQIGSVRIVRKREYICLAVSELDDLFIINEGYANMPEASKFATNVLNDAGTT